MTEIWNFWGVKPPPVCTVKTDLYFKEMNDLNEITHDALITLKRLGHFDREAAILSRFLYKYRRIFRHDKGVQNLVKVNQCLKRYLKLNMLEVLFTFKQSIPFNFNPISTHVYLPTRQMLKWVLLRLQAFSQIFVRVIELTKAAGSHIYKKLYLGWSLHNSLFFFCITARILVTSKYLVTKSIEWYSSFYKFLPYLRETSDYLSGYNFPLDLKLWLGEVDLTPLKKKTFIDNIFEFIDLVKDDEERDEDDIDTVMNEKFMQLLFNFKILGTDSDVEEIKIGETQEKIGEVKQPLQPSSPYEDLGVPVEDNEKEAPKKRKRRRTFIDLVPEGDNREEAAKEIKETKRSKRRSIDLVSIRDDKEEEAREIKKSKSSFTDVVSLEDNKEEEAAKKRRKRTRKRKKEMN